MTTTAWESDLWNEFGKQHPLWRVLVPCLQPELRNRWFTELVTLLDHECDDDTEYCLSLKANLRKQLYEGQAEHKTALYLTCLALFPEVSQHALQAEKIDIREWIDRDVPECLEMWTSATHGDQLALFVALCALRFRQAVAMDVMASNAAKNNDRRFLTN